MDEHQIQSSGIQTFNDVKMSQICDKKHLFNVRLLITYYILKHMDAVDSTDFFFFPLLHLLLSEHCK